MHKRATGIVVGFVAVVAIAATLDAVFFRNHAPASTRGTTSEASDVTGTLSDEPLSAAPPCRSNQFQLTVNRGDPRNRSRHDDYVALTHIRGSVCRFSGRFKHFQIFGPDGLAEGGVIQDEGANFAGTYGASLGGHIFRFRFSPNCSQPGPFAVHVQVGDYVASGKIRVFRCGIGPPPFQ
jgi:hypothetical protein